MAIGKCIKSDDFIQTLDMKGTRKRVVHGRRGWHGGVRGERPSCYYMKKRIDKGRREGKMGGESKRNAKMGILEELTEMRRLDAIRDAAARPLAMLEREISGMPPAVDFRGAFAGRGGIIAEIKRASPSEGNIRVGLDVVEVAREYEAAGAAAISVLCEPHRFKGSREDLAAAAGVVKVPLLCKDFVAGRYPIAAARVAGASAVLLIAAVLGDKELRELREYAEEVGLEALVEAHTSEEVRRAVGCGARVVGVNCRDLRTFSTDPGITAGLLGEIPAGCVRIAESGIRGAADVARLRAAGADGFLVGTALMKAADPGAKLKELIGGLE